MPSRLLEIEFLGGPFDGHRQLVSVPVAELAETVVFPISSDVLCLLNGKHRQAGAPTTSLAVFRLETGPRGPRYRFQRALAPVAVES